ncbi:MAG: hypothetical protein EOO56_13935 [Hymenobacter sp.]|nr:MAG: hypothetical protein EOO56_13935 [Hymenobacter sp.]
MSFYQRGQQPAAPTAPAAKAAHPADAIFRYPPLPAQALKPVISPADLHTYVSTLPSQVQEAAKTRNVVFMADCLPKLVGHLRHFSAEAQQKGLTMAQLQDNNNAFIHTVVARLRDAYDLEEAEEHKNDPKNPATGKSFKEEAEVYKCGLQSYLPLFNKLMATRPTVTILTQPDLVKVFMVLPDGYRNLGVSRLSKTLQSGVYTLIFTKPGYQSMRKTFAAQSTPVQVFRVALPPSK